MEATMLTSATLNTIVDLATTPNHQLDKIERWSKAKVEALKETIRLKTVFQTVEVLVKSRCGQQVKPVELKVYSTRGCPAGKLIATVLIDKYTNRDHVSITPYSADGYRGTPTHLKTEEHCGLALHVIEAIVEELKKVTTYGLTDTIMESL